MSRRRTEDYYSDAFNVYETSPVFHPVARTDSRPQIFMSVGKTLTRPPRGSTQSTNVKARPSGQTKLGKTSSSQSDPRQKGKNATSTASATSKLPTGKVKGVTYFYVDLQSDHTSSSSSTAQTASASKASASSKTRSSFKKTNLKGDDHTMHSLGVATIHPDDTAHNRGVQATRGGASPQELAHLEAEFARNGVDQWGGFIAVIRGWPHVTPGGDQNHHWTLMILDSTGDVINWDISFPSFRRGMRNQRIIHIASLQGQPDGAFFTPTGSTALMGAQDWRRIERTTFIYRNPWNTPQDVVYLRGIWTKYGQLAASHQLAP